MNNTKKPGDGGRKPFKGGGKSPDRGGKPVAKKSFASKPREMREKNPDHIAVTGEGERISKIMARAGVASRRDCERMILEGRVKLNDVTLTTPAVNCTPADRIEVDGEVIGAIERTRLWIYYKPAGLVTTNFDPEGRPTVFDNLPEELPRVISVGRLDINTEGLLLLTNDGGLARMLELPTTGWLRRYRVRAYGSIDQEKLDSLKEGIAVDGVFYGSIEATLDREKGHNVWITMGLREGKNREIKNVLGAIGLDVNRLIRISYGPFQLGELEEGHVVEVKSRTLRDQLGPRLIAEANANFEAPIHNVVVPDAEEEPVAHVERPKRENREDRRERDLARIDTKRPERSDRPRERSRDRDDDRRGAPRGKDRDDDKKKKRPPLGTSRTANVWMAPGARPVAVKKAKDETPETGPKRRVLRLKTSGDDATGAAPASATRARRPERSERPERKDRPDRADRPAGGPFKARRDERGAEGGRERPERAFEGKRSEGRPSDGKPRSDKPRGNKPFGDKPRGDKPFGDKPRGDKPFGDRKRDGAAKGAKSFAGKPERKGPGDGPRKNGPGAGGPGSRGTKSGADRRR